MRKTLGNMLIMGLILISGTLKSQVLPVQEVQIALKPLVPLVIPNAVMDTLTDPFYLFQQDSSLQVSLNIILQDTIALDIIHVKLGTTLGDSNLIAQSFNYDGTNVTPGLNFSRSLNNVKIDLGIQPNTVNGLYFVEVKLQDTAGNQSIVTTTDTSQ